MFINVHKLRTVNNSPGLQDPWYRVKHWSEEDLALVCFLFVLLNGMNHCSSSENSVTEHINRLCSSVHPDLQNYVPQKPARIHGDELLKGHRGLWREKWVEWEYSVTFNFKLCNCRFSPEDFFHILSERPTNGCYNSMKLHFAYLKKKHWI